MKQQIEELLKQVLFELGITGLDPAVEIPEDPRHGEYTTNVAMRLAKELKKPPMDIALEAVENIKYQISNIKKERQDQNIVKKYQTRSIKLDLLNTLQAIDRVDAVPPGFINFWLTEAKLGNQLAEVIKIAESYGKTQVQKPQKIVVEHTSPNTIKTLHLGHVRNNVLGMAVGRLLTAAGNKVFYDAINNDRGIHVMKANWAYLAYGKQSEPIALSQPQKNWKQLIGEWREDDLWRTPGAKEKKDEFVDQFYVLGVQAEEKWPQVKAEMQEMLQAWEAKDPQVRELWRTLRDWVLAGFKETYQRLGSHHDVQWFESDLYEEGKQLIEEGLRKGAFRKLPDGAVLTDLKDMKLSDTVVLRADGTALYMTFDPNLTRYKREHYDADLYIWDIGPEQTLYLKQMFAICEKLGIGKRSDYLHLSYGFVYLKGKGKMSSRAGMIVTANQLIDTMQQRALALIKRKTEFTNDEKKEIAEKTGIGALKYGLLKVGRSTDIYFDIDESLSLEGDSGPYIQYTYARCRSVLRKFQLQKVKPFSLAKKGLTFFGRLNPEERAVARLILYFPEVIAQAAQKYAPNLLCIYLYQLAQAFNLFYQKHTILGGAGKSTDNLQPTIYNNQVALRLTLTAATAQVLHNGLYLLGIATLERM